MKERDTWNDVREYVSDKMNPSEGFQKGGWYGEGIDSVVVRGFVHQLIPGNRVIM